MTGSLGVSHDRSNGGSSVSMPVSDNGTYVSLIKVENGYVDNPILTFINKDYFEQIQEIINEHENFINSELKKCVSKYENKRIGIFDKGVKFEFEKVEIPELEDYIPSDKFIGLVESKEVVHKCVTTSFKSRKIDIKNT